MPKENMTICPTSSPWWKGSGLVAIRVEGGASFKLSWTQAVSCHQSPLFILGGFPLPQQ